MIQTDPAGNFVLVNDLGLDRTIVWAFDRTTGTLSTPKTTPSSPGAGPRHFVFHPSGTTVYSINEEASTLAVMSYDAPSGTLTPMQEISTLPKDFVGTTFASEVQVSPDGRFVYASNRLRDSITIFSMQPTGKLKRQSDIWTRSDYPRSFTLGPTGRFLYAGNQRSDNLTTSRLSRSEDEDGLSFSG